MAGGEGQSSWGASETIRLFCVFQRIEIRRTTENVLSTLFLKLLGSRKINDPKNIQPYLMDMPCIDTASTPLMRTESTRTKRNLLQKPKFRGLWET